MTVGELLDALRYTNPAAKIVLYAKQDEHEPVTVSHTGSGVIVIGDDPSELNSTEHVLLNLAENA